MPEVLAVCDAAQDAPHWPPDAWRNFVEPSSYAGRRESLILLARMMSGEVLGWLAATSIYETAELEYVLVHPRYRGKGVGRQLMEHWLTWAQRQGALEALLEVRPSNLAASRLYRELGFVERGRRQAYYQNPREDAVLMWHSLQPRELP
jgi:ribosomal-protein-alanine acetyltransferase